MQMLFFLMQCNFFHKDGVGLTMMGNAAIEITTVRQRKGVANVDKRNSDAIKP